MMRIGLALAQYGPFAERGAVRRVRHWRPKGAAGEGAASGQHCYLSGDHRARDLRATPLGVRWCAPEVR
jgi:hypothetical protein